MAPELAAVGLQAIGGLGQGIVDSIQNNRNNRRTIAAQMRLAEMQYQKQVEFWHMQNRYNSPEEQMKRFGAAGLNPHLIYGQGNPGNANQTPQYQPPAIQYKMAAPRVGPALEAVIPTLMQVGTWMQNMRLSEAELEAKRANTDKVQQLVEYLSQRNPLEIKKLDNALSLFPYQKSMADYSSQKVGWQVNDLINEFEYKFGVNRSGGVRAQQMLQEIAKTRLKQAESSWTDFSVTNPQALMQLVLGGVMGMAGTQLRLSTHRPKGSKVVETEKVKRVGRERTTRREYWRKD